MYNCGMLNLNILYFNLKIHLLLRIIYSGCTKCVVHFLECLSKILSGKLPPNWSLYVQKKRGLDFFLNLQQIYLFVFLLFENGQKNESIRISSVGTYLKKITITYLSSYLQRKCGSDILHFVCRVGHDTILQKKHSKELFLRSQFSSLFWIMQTTTQ